MRPRISACSIRTRRPPWSRPNAVGTSAAVVGQTSRTRWDTISRRADRSIDFDFYRKRATAPRARAPRNAAVWLSAVAGVLTMATIYLVLLFAAAYMRAPNFHVSAPAVAIPNAPDVIF